MNQYTRILNAATAIQANAETIHQNVIGFAEKFGKSILAVNASLDSINTSFASMTQENLTVIKQKLHKFDREINQDFKKPLLQLQKQSIKLTQILTQRIMPFTLSKEIDVTPIKQHAELIQQLLQKSTNTIEACLISIKICQSKIAHLYKMLSSLELPDNIVKTTKQIKQATQNMAILNAKVLEDDKTLGRYAAEFKDLGGMLEAFKVEANRIGSSPSP